MKITEKILLKWVEKFVGPTKILLVFTKIIFLGIFDF
jgi:hypothetical protein